MSSIQKRLKNKAQYIMLAIAITRFVIDKSIYSLSFLTNFLILIFGMAVYQKFPNGESIQTWQEIFAKEINADKLKLGMILSETIQKKEK